MDVPHEAVLLRIFTGSDDRYGLEEPLYRAISKPKYGRDRADDESIDAVSHSLWNAGERRAETRRIVTEG